MTMAQTANVLEVSDLRVQFPSSHGVVRAVDGVTFHVGRGEAVGIVGESGSGKSMTALAILRLVPKPGMITGGDMRLDERDLQALSDDEIRAVRLSDIAMIFQDAGSYLNPIMKVEDQIAEAIGRRGSRDPKVRAQVWESLEVVRIPDPDRVAASYPHELSGGMQQRAMIASVLIRKPRLIIADEPTTALDVTVQYQILKFLAELRSEIDASIILITHDLAVVSEVCDRVYVMYAGQIVEEGRTDTMFNEPKHPYTQALVDSILDPFETKLSITALEGSPPDMAAPPSGCRFHPRCKSAFDPCYTTEPTNVELAAGTSAKCWLHAQPGARS
jgi:oligopeptide/dipeptide ABC transporter ATP-binding protein